MMAHSPAAWEHLLFKDVAVKVSNMDIYYKALQFYLDENPQLLNDLLQVEFYSHRARKTRTLKP